MNLDTETVEAIRGELQKYRNSQKENPDMRIGNVGICGCMGPQPECFCAKRERLVAAFLENTNEVQNG